MRRRLLAGAHCEQRPFCAITEIVKFIAAIQYLCYDHRHGPGEAWSKLEGARNNGFALLRPALAAERGCIQPAKQGAGIFFIPNGCNPLKSLDSKK
jgi:hypothetical protein